MGIQRGRKAFTFIDWNIRTPPRHCLCFRKFSARTRRRIAEILPLKAARLPPAAAPRIILKPAAAPAPGTGPVWGKQVAQAVAALGFRSLNQHPTTSNPHYDLSTHVQ